MTKSVYSSSWIIEIRKVFENEEQIQSDIDINCKQIIVRGGGEPDPKEGNVAILNQGSKIEISILLFSCLLMKLSLQQFYWSQ